MYKKNKKICIVNMQIYALFNHDSDAPIGGTEVQLYFLTKYLSKNDKFDVNVVTGDWGQENIEKYDDINVIKSFSLKRTFWNYIKAPFVLWNSLFESNSDVYIASSVGIEIGIIAFFCKIHKKKFIYRTASDIDCDGTFIARNFFIGQFYKYGLKHADRIITQNEKNKKQLQDNYGINAIIIRNSWDIEVNNKEKKEFILWVSRCETLKNPQIFLELAKKIPEQKFVMICPIQKNEVHLFYEIKVEARKLNNVKFINFVSFDKIQTYYDQARLFVNTSDFEGFPNTFVQACLGGVPIVSYKVNPDNFLIEEDVGYFADGDKKRLLDILKNSIKNEMEWNEKSKNCYEYVKKYHNIQKNGKMWKDEINLLLK